jgi:lysyl-tRNA synthetase class 2
MTTPAGAAWRPTASRARLELRARLLGLARGFFAARRVLEVDTPQLVSAPASDATLQPAEVRLGVGGDGGARYFLHTSPEYAMKRLLAAGVGDLYQICHVFRADERGALHNPEFTLIEWYRLDFSLEALMEEVAALVAELLADRAPRLAAEQLRYRDAFRAELGLDPLEAAEADLRSAAVAAGLDPLSAVDCDRDQLLDALMGLRVGPRLGRGRLTFLHRYPASQAALAELDPEDPRVALRFELYVEGIELANGFRELRQEAEQRRRFESDQALRQRRGLPVHPLDEALLAALAAGLPAASGVALGFDRLVMLAAGVTRIDEILAFPIERA